MNFTLKTNWMVDVPTINQRLYPKETFQLAIDKYMTSNDLGGWIMVKDMPPPQDLFQMTHVTQSMKIDEDGRISAVIKTLSNEEGLLLSELLKATPEKFFLFYEMIGLVDKNGVVSLLSIKRTHVGILDPD